ncbi:MAG: Glutamate synthase (NADPH) small chain [Planctomycetes bacterium ADurb.Bin126]|nr:MAG: Glutamate synthase (NADPH) small chain [Planctomycetes bacterium ADurb.Bin126]HOD80480.1 glutamate synthase subunit beta [Phycisphaerae bacterium]HQL72092.1 glutamate synthase subunit beta [Phycisphaerae bacterium]
MAKPTGFIEYRREDVPHREIDQRVGDYFEIELPLPEDRLLAQAARCMDCGIPFCHGIGCPLHNRIPEFNDLVYRGRWKEACDVLHSTNNFPEITGRICPAPCEAACTLNINDQPVLIRHIEDQIVERGFAEGWIQPLIPPVRTGKRVAVIGSGPAGLAAAQQLARLGHEVVVFEKDDRVGGLLRYGIPDFKLDKKILDRRLDQLRSEGVQFQTSVEVGVDLSARYLRQRFHAVLLTMGATQPRDLVVPGRGYENIHFAMEYLTQQNRLNAGLDLGPARPISARGRVVAVIGGGDTGSDCVGTARRQGAREIYQFEVLPKPPEQRPSDTPWPVWPRVLRTSSSHEEGCNRRWSVLTRKLSGIDVRVSELHGCEVEWTRAKDGSWKMAEKPGTDFSLKVDLVLLAVGFVHVVHSGLVEQLGVKLDTRGNVEVDAQSMTSVEGVFAAGDTASGASLVVRAINAGRLASDSIHHWLQNR